MRTLFYNLIAYFAEKLGYELVQEIEYDYFQRAAKVFDRVHEVRNNYPLNDSGKYLVHFLVTGESAINPIQQQYFQLTQEEKE